MGPVLMYLNLTEQKEKKTLLIFDKQSNEGHKSKWQQMLHLFFSNIVYRGYLAIRGGKMQRNEL